jgi:hypothetical protein
MDLRGNARDYGVWDLIPGRTKVPGAGGKQASSLKSWEPGGRKVRGGLERPEKAGQGRTELSKQEWIERLSDGREFARAARLREREGADISRRTVGHCLALPMGCLPKARQDGPGWPCL